SGRRLGTDRRPDAPGREGLLLLPRSRRRHLWLEGRERGYLGGGASALRFRGHTACQRLRGRDSGDRRPRRDGGHRVRRPARSRRAAPASHRAAARLRAAAFSTALSAGRGNRHLLSSGRDSTRAYAPTHCTSIIPSCAPTPHSTRRCTTASSQEPSVYELGQRHYPDTDTTLRPQARAPPTFRYKGISVFRRIAALTTR